MCRKGGNIKIVNGNEYIELEAKHSEFVLKTGDRITTLPGY